MSVDLTMMSDLVTPWAIRVVATLRVADAMDRGHRRLEALAKECGAQPDPLRRVLRYLVRRGLFAEPEPDHFALRPPGELLREHAPFSMRAWFDLDGMGGRMDQAFSGLLHTVRTGEAAYPKVHGRTLWEDTGEDPALGRSYAALMAEHSRWSAPELARAYEFPEQGHLVDVGGGSGSLLCALLPTRPALHATLIDLPVAAEAARAAFLRAGISDRVEVQARSFFEPLPAAADLYVLGWVLHDWSDDEALQILTRCADAACRRRGGAARVLVAEHLFVEDRRATMSAAMDLRLLALFGGRERTPAQLDELIARANMRVVGRHSTGGGIHLVTCAPDGADR